MEQSSTKTIRPEEGYTDPSRERRRELGELVLKYKASEKINSIQGLCGKIHPHCETISEALFCGAFIDFLMSEGKSRDERVATIKEKITSAIAGSILEELLSKAATGRKEEEKPAQA